VASVRHRGAVVASGLAIGLAAGLARPTAARADDARDVFGLARRPPADARADQAGCGDGLAFSCAIATDPLDDATPYALSTWLPASYLRRLPVADFTHDRVAGYALGAGSDGAGPTFGGATGLENRWTIDGAPADSLRTGVADTQVPLAFLDGLLVSAGGFSARDRASTGGTADARLRRGTADHQVEAEAWLTLTADAANRPAATGTYAVRRLGTGTGPQATVSLVATGPIGDVLGGHAWYAAGVAPTISASDFTWRASRLVDDNADGVPDGLPGDVAISPFERTSARTYDYAAPVMARAGLDRGAHHLELSLIGTADRDTRFLANSTRKAAGVDRSAIVGDAIATWRGAWAETRARVQLAWHHSARRDAAHDPDAAHIPQVLGAYIPANLVDDPVLAAACNDAAPGDPVPTLANCPVPFGLFASGGAGQLTSTVGDRPSITADLTRRFGRHVARVGATSEYTRLVTTSTFTGNEEQFTLFPGELSHRQFYLGACSDAPGAACDYATGSQLDYRTVYAAAYAEDTYTPAPGLSIDGGVRWELMWVGERLHFSNELAPRVGVAWDVLGGGRSRVWASFDRTFALLPAGLGPTVIRRDATVDDFNLQGATSRVHDTGTSRAVAAGVEPIAQDELTVGAEVALAGALRATVWGQERYLRRGLETTPDGLDNPGRNGDPSATREAELIAFQLEMAASDKLVIRSGILWGRTVGTFAGPYDPRQGANLYAGADWDAGSSNLYGALPTDPGGHVFVEAERRGALGPVGFAIATRLTVGSGTPRSVLANGTDGVTDLLPRSSAGRNPMLSQANLRLAATWRGFTATLDVMNVFDRRDPTSVDEIYTDDAVRPVEGGELSDLVFLKTDSGQPARRRTSYQLPIAFQLPLAAALGIHKVF
jgi:hypothetical protein